MTFQEYAWHTYARENEFKTVGEWYYTLCPNCKHHARKFAINIQNGRNKCFHCNTSVNWRMHGISLSNSSVKYPNLLNYNKITEYNANLTNNKYRHSVISYLVNKRKLNLDLCNYYKLGYIPSFFLSETNCEEECICIPELRNKQVVSLDIRFIRADCPSRYRSFGERTLFNYEAVMQSKAKSCVVTEGRFDALSAIQLSPHIPVIGFPNKSILKKEWAEVFHKFERIYIAIDNTPESEQEVEKIAQFVGKYKAYRVIYPAKDVNELLNVQDCAGIWERALLAAKPVFTPIICRIADIQKEAVKYYVDPNNAFISTGYKELDSIAGGIRPGELTILTGNTGIGKTTLGVSLCCNLAKQPLQDSGLNAHKSLIGSFELPWYSYIAPKVLSFLIGRNIELEPRLSQTQYDSYLTWLNKWDMIRGINRTGQIGVDDVLEAIYQSYQLGFRFVVLDHLHYVIKRGDSAWEKQEIDNFFVLLQKLVKQELPKLAILLMVHPKKVEIDLKTKFPRRITGNDLKGSSNIYQDADNVWLLNRDYQTNQIDLEVDKLRVDRANILAHQKVIVKFDKARFNYEFIHA